jgi:TP901-1 family phage major tail protein
MAQGVNFKIYVDKSSSGSAQWVAVAGQRGGKLNRSASVHDTTTKDGNGWAEKRTGIKEWSIDGDGVVVFSDEGWKLLETAFNTNKVVKVHIGESGGVTYSGSAVISDFPIDMPYDNECTYSLKLEGTGALTFSESGVTSLETKVVK